MWTSPKKWDFNCLRTFQKLKEELHFITKSAYYHTSFSCECYCSVAQPFVFFFLLFAFLMQAYCCLASLVWFWTTLICCDFLFKNCRPHYNLNLQSIAVNGKLLPIDPSVFATSNSQGTIVDSGTTLAYLVAEAYDPFVSAVSNFPIYTCKGSCYNKRCLQLREMSFNVLFFTILSYSNTIFFFHLKY
jgi:hypothetical protein